MKDTKKVMMNKQANKLIPELRFPEFVNDGEWEVKTLNDVCEITNGKANAQDHVENGKYPLFDRSEVIKSTNNFIFDCEAVIIPGEGMRFVPKYYEGKFNLHQRAYALKDFICNGKFVYYSMVFNSNLLSRKAVQSTVLSLRLPILQTFPIFVPKEPTEQQKIASCLSSLDELLTAHTNKLETLKTYKKGLMQNLFPQGGEKVPKIRFKEFEKDGEWEENKLRDCLLQSPEYGINAAAVPFSEKLPKYLRITDISEDGRMVLNNKVSVSKDVIENNYLNDGDIVFARTGASVGKSYKYRIEDGRLVFAGFLIRVKPNKEKLVSDFLFQFVSSNRYWKWVNFISARSGQPGINSIEYSSMAINLPPKTKEQQKIADTLSSLDELIKEQTNKIEELKLHKKGLMQGLFPKMKN